MDIYYGGQIQYDGVLSREFQVATTRHSAGLDHSYELLSLKEFVYPMGRL